MKGLKIKQNSFTNKDDGKIIAYVSLELVTEDFGTIQLQVPKEHKKVVNFLARKQGFVIGETDTLPSPKTLEFCLSEDLKI